ncbi:ABC transporter substrate-binding protein [Saccharopolyspora sp. K220]|uniref:ABC transporter substrate-binding protein n=1 Tax=Saccharopolyspora soli TaxID=2926618 RepID=UPI001F58ADD9|nr:ABC transporter substrate-binding protein [Saccharopolyspora soli]MCI2416408.1 ABC transporter substrate-binding protein [Saccharopolyspora soli]
MPAHRKRFAAATLAGLLTVTAACGGINTEATGSASGGAGSTFRFAYTVGPSRYDPHRASSSFDNATLFPVYDRLVHLTTMAEPVPGLATGWHYADDGKRLVLELRPGVRFHDGTPFDAAAAKANLDRARTLEGSTVASELRSVTRVDVLGPLSVELVLSAPDSSLVGALSDRAGMMVSPAAFDDPQLDLRPVGAGPYQIVSYSPNDRVVLRRSPGYWDPAAQLVETMVIVIQSDQTTRMNALRAGEVDAALLQGNQVAEARQYDLGVVGDVTLAFYHLQLNRTRSEFDDVRVRRALNHAIDREAIIAGVLFGNGAPAVQPFPPGYYANDPELPDLYPYDPRKARQLLAEAGLPGGFEFEAIVPSTDPGVAVALQEQLAEVGVRMNIGEAASSEAADLFYGRQQGDAMVAPWGGRADPIQTLGLLYGSKGFSNPGGHTLPQLEQLIGQVRQTIDPAARAELFHRIGGIVVDQALDVPVVFADTNYGHAPRVTGLRSWLSNKPEFRGVGTAGTWR